MGNGNNTIIIIEKLRNKKLSKISIQLTTALNILEFWLIYILKASLLITMLLMILIIIIII